MPHDSRHQCLIYTGAPSDQLPAIAGEIRKKLAQGFRCLYLNSRPMVAGLRSLLASTNLDVAAEIANARLILSSDTGSDADGEFNVDLMLTALEHALDHALHDGYKGLFATGDMTWEFGSEKNLAKLVDYERRLEQLFLRRPQLTGICQYHRDTLPPDIPRQALLTHQHIFINETLSRLNPYYLLPYSPDAPLPISPHLDLAIATLCQPPDNPPTHSPP
ncbi:MAG: MEDS domain-containing protein [Phycisphaerae bacterium]